MKKAIRREKVIGFTQARRSFDALLHLVKRGYAFRIKRRGRPDMRLDPVTTSPIPR